MLPTIADKRRLMAWVMWQINVELEQAALTPQQRAELLKFNAAAAEIDETVLREHQISMAEAAAEKRRLGRRKWHKDQRDQQRA